MDIHDHPALVTARAGRQELLDMGFAEEEATSGVACSELAGLLADAWRPGLTHDDGRLNVTALNALSPSGGVEVMQQLLRSLYTGSRIALPQLGRLDAPTRTLVAVHLLLIGVVPEPDSDLGQFMTATIQAYPRQP